MSKSITPQQFQTLLKNAKNKFDTEMFRARREIGVMAVNHFKLSFDRMGFNAGQDKWAPRLRNYKHPMMNKTGNLKNSISVLASTESQVIVGTNVPYAKFHNDGVSENGAPYTRNQFSSTPITRRQFIGNSTSLERDIKNRLELALKNTFKQTIL